MAAVSPCNLLGDTGKGAASESGTPFLADRKHNLQEDHPAVDGKKSFETVLKLSTPKFCTILFTMSTSKATAFHHIFSQTDRDNSINSAGSHLAQTRKTLPKRQGVLVAGHRDHFLCTKSNAFKRRPSLDAHHVGDQILGHNGEGKRDDKQILIKRYWKF